MTGRGEHVQRKSQIRGKETGAKTESKVKGQNITLHSVEKKEKAHNMPKMFQEKSPAARG